MATTEEITATIARNAGALYNFGFGKTNMDTYVAQAGTDASSLLNDVFTAVFGTNVEAAADALVSNLGITDGASAARDYIVAQLNAADPAQRGVAVDTMLVLWAGLATDPTFGAAATAWNNKVTAAIAYAADPANTSDTTFVTASAAADVTAPVFSSATVSGTSVVLTYGEDLDSASVPAVTDFAVTVGGTAATVSSVAISGATVTLTLSAAVANTDTVTVAYTRPATNPLQDAAGNDVATMAAATVTNSTGQTFTLTSGIDVVNGTSADDVITSSLGTLSTVDEIHGGAGNDSLTVTFDPLLATAGSATAAAPSIDGVETITLTNNVDPTTLNMANIDSALTTLNVVGHTNFGLQNMGLTAVNADFSAALELDLLTATASTAALGLTLNVTNGSSLTLLMGSAGGGAAAVGDDFSTADILTINAIGNFGNSAAGNLDFSGIEQLVVSGNGNVELNLNIQTVTATHPEVGTAWADTFNDLTAIHASGLAGNLTVHMGLSGADLNIAGGAGNDTFIYTADLGTNDSIDGGAGNDVLNAAITGYLRPTITNVETLSLNVGATAVTADLFNVSGVNTINLLTKSNTVLDKLGSAVTVINVNSANVSAASGLVVQYGTAAAASDVSLNLGIASQSEFQLSAATASAMTLGNVSFSGNSGSLNVKVVDSASYTLDALTANDFTAVSLDAVSANLTVSGVANLGTAQTISLMAQANHTLSIGGDLSAVGADTVSINAAGASAMIDLNGTANFGTANTVTLTTNADLGGGTGICANQLLFQSAAGATGAANLDTLTINALGGDVFVGCAQILSGATSISLGMNVSMGSTAVAVTIGDLGLYDIATAATANEQSVNMTISGTGNFTLNSANIATANLTVSVNSTALASGSNLVMDLSKVNASAVVSAVFGAHSGSFIGGQGADNITMGLGAMTVNGGLGADTITLNNTAVSRVELSTAAVTSVDTIVGAGSGDTILFINSTTAATALASGTAYLTGASTDTAQIATSSLSGLSTAAALTAAKQIAIFTSNGDTIIQVMMNTASASLTAGATAGVTGGGYHQVVLSNKDFAAITAAFQLNTTGSGLSVTLL